MNIEAPLPGRDRGAEVGREIAGIVSLWSDLRGPFAAGGDFLFEAFCAADAFCAPVVSRFRTYGVELPQVAAAYADAVFAPPAVREWCEEARQERCFLLEDETYRCDPTRPG